MWGEDVKGYEGTLDNEWRTAFENANNECLGY